MGGGSLLGETLPTRLLGSYGARPRVDGAALRTAAAPVVCRIQRDTLLFDPHSAARAGGDVVGDACCGRQRDGDAGPGRRVRGAPAWLNASFSSWAACSPPTSGRRKHPGWTSSTGRRDCCRVAQVPGMQLVIGHEARAASAT
ncbi:MAG: hypothetical protein R3A10_15920 [Caldilineaceae bacterium]